ncbi:MAG: molybdopterin-dependent oxidoreductase [Gordonibacter sp.]|nr:molybdopterin-dependent oxidoreductase [Gordonibacter sp.]
MSNDTALGGSIERRTFLKWTATAGAAIGGTGLLASCSSASAEGETEGSPIPEMGNSNKAISDGLPYGADKVVTTVCGCGDVCGCLHTGSCYVKDGKLVYYEGCNEGWNKGALCARGEATMQIVNSPDRVKYPMRRTNEKGVQGEFERISWDEAVEEITAKLADIIENDGPESVACVTTHCGNRFYFTSSIQFSMLFSFESGEFAAGCFNDEKMGPTVTLGDWYHWLEHDMDETKLILLWGENDVLAKPQEWSDGYAEAQRKGAFLVSLESRFSETSEKCDMYIPVRPGTDAYVALAMANVIITEGLVNQEFVDKYTYGYEEFKELCLKYTPELVEKISWAPADKVRQVARMYATMKPAMLEVGRGGNQTGGDTSNSSWMMSRAITCLIGLTGQVGVRGSAFSQEASGQAMNGMWFHWPFLSVYGAPAMAVKPLVERKKSESQNIWGMSEAMYNPDFDWHTRAMISNSNPGAAAGDQAYLAERMKELPLYVSINRAIHWTASQFGDYLLPASTFVEQYCYREDWEALALTVPAIDPMFESKSDHEIFKSLALALAKKIGATASEEEIWPYRDDEDFANLIASNPLTLNEYKTWVDSGDGRYKDLLDLDIHKAAARPGGLIPNPFYAGQRGEFIPYKAKTYQHEGGIAPADMDPEEIFFPTYTGRGDDPEGKGSDGKLLFKADWLPQVDPSLPALPIPDEPFDSYYAEGNPIESGNWELSDAVKNGYDLVAVGKGHKFWQFLSFNQNYDGGPVSSWQREAFQSASEPCVEVNQVDLERLGLKDGDYVTVESQYGSMENIRIIENECIIPGTIVPPYHWGNVQNRIYPYSLSFMHLDPKRRPKLTPQLVGKWGFFKCSIAGGQCVQSAVLCKIYKA